MHARKDPSDLLCCDLHCDTVQELQGGADLGRGNPAGHVDLARLRKGRVGLQVFACFVPSHLPESRAFRQATLLLDEIDRLCERLPAHFRKVETVEGAESARTEGKVGVMPAVENGHAIENDLGKLEPLRRRGVRYMTLTHFKHLRWAASSGEPFTGDHGLTSFGCEVVREMGELGILVDTSHVHERTFWDVARLVRKPFIASHSNAAALCPIPRNLTDDQIKGVAAAGGMVGINFCPGFLDSADFKGNDVGTRNPPAAELETVVRHIEHVIRLVGDDHVGFGSDFDGVPDLPRGIPDCTVYPEILSRLAERGLGEAALAKIAWGNFMRVLRAAER